MGGPDNQSSQTCRAVEVLHVHAVICVSGDHDMIISTLCEKFLFYIISQMSDREQRSSAQDFQRSARVKRITESLNFWRLVTEVLLLCLLVYRLPFNSRLRTRPVALGPLFFNKDGRWAVTPLIIRLYPSGGTVRSPISYSHLFVNHDEYLFRPI